jgi:hypothetical protein
MSELGDVFAGDASISAAKIDAKSFAVMTGTKIAALSSGQAIAAAIPTSTTGGFTLNVPVYRKTDGSGWLPFFTKHLHLADTDADGGTYYAIRKANGGLILISSLGDNRNAFYSEVSGTGAAVADNTQTTYSNISVSAGTTNGGYASIFVSTVKISFASPIFLQMKVNESVGTSILTRLGVGIEKVQNSVDNTQKIGIEGCDSDGTNFRLLAADGTARSKIDGLTAIATSTKALRITYTPGANTILEAGYGGTVATLTTNTPVSGTLANENQLFRAGVKSTTTTARIINLFAMQLFGKADTADWF